MNHTWQVMPLRDDHGRPRLAVVAGQTVIFWLNRGEIEQAAKMCIWRNAALTYARQAEPVA